MRRCSARSARLRQASAAPSRRALSTGSARRASSRQVTACLRYAAGVSTTVLPLPSQKLGRPIIKIRLNCRALTSTCQAAIEPADQYAGMPSMPTGIDPASLSNIDHCRSHGIDRITVWCLTPFCCHQGMVTFEAFAAHGAGETTKFLSVKPRLKCTKCGGRGPSKSAGMKAALGTLVCALLPFRSTANFRGALAQSMPLWPSISRPFFAALSWHLIPGGTRTGGDGLEHSRRLSAKRH